MATNGNGEKRIATLPPIRIGEQLERALMREAARQDRSLSDLVRVALTQWLRCHGSNDDGASES
jgi:predicted HicB family RNase H-like nuclease